MTYDEILSRFRVSRRSGDTCQCLCPAHDDHRPSLTISHRGNRTLVCCHAGCSTADVLGAVGLSVRDLFDEPISRHGNGRGAVYGRNARTNY